MGGGAGPRPTDDDGLTDAEDEADMRNAYAAARDDGYEPDSTSMKALAAAETRHQVRRRSKQDAATARSAEAEHDD
jgi:hypothetical protein